MQEQTDRLMRTVLDAVHALTLTAKPSPYAKRWWTQDLSELRRLYTHARNAARSQRRSGIARPELEEEARKAAKEYHEAIHRRQRAHWDNFLANDTNIWKATKYLQPASALGTDRIPSLVRADGSRTKDGTSRHQSSSVHSPRHCRNRSRKKGASAKGSGSNARNDYRRSRTMRLCSKAVEGR